MMSHEKFFMACVTIVFVVFIVCVCIDDIYEKYFEARWRFDDEQKRYNREDKRD